MRSGAAELIRQAAVNVGRYDVDGLKRSGFLPKDGRYFPAVLYPPVPMYGSLGEDEFFGKCVRGAGGPLVVYAHIPFCVSKCRFCHFVSYDGVSPLQKDAYLDALSREQELYLDRMGMSTLPVEAINVGGGTATCLSPRQLQTFLASFTGKMEMDSCEQFTCDVDVSTLLGGSGLERLRILHGSGVDRITIGVQVLDDSLLRDMNRPNVSKDVYTAVRNSRLAGIDNICLDLIYGYPGQTLESWHDTLRQVTSLDIDSFQIYRLRIKPHNLLPGSIAERHARHPEQFPSIDRIYLMKELAGLVAGSEGYSDERYTTVFSRSNRGISSYHRKKFCHLYDVLGFGLAANNVLHGNVGIKTRSIEKYCTRIAEGKIPVEQGKICGPEDIARRAVVGPLRNLSRIDETVFREKTGLAASEVFSERVNALEAAGILSTEDGVCHLTATGHFFVDEACIHFFHPDYIPFPEAAYADGELNPHHQPLSLNL